MSGEFPSSHHHFPISTRCTLFVAAYFRPKPTFYQMQLRICTKVFSKINVNKIFFFSILTSGLLSDKPFNLKIIYFACFILFMSGGQEIEFQEI
jgi:hypothetical protein